MQVDLLTPSTSVLRVETHNGDITYDGSKDGNMGAIQVLYVRHGGASSEDEAGRALAAIAIYAEPRDGKMVLGWRWSEKKQSEWGGSVDFEVVGTPAMPIEAASHNGDIDVRGSTALVVSQTHNGDIRVATDGSRVRAASHNGEIDLTTSGDEVEVKTHNGDISIDFADADRVAGSVETHNGDIVIKAGAATSARLHFRTRNGSFSGGGDRVQAIDKRNWEVELGRAETELRVETFNGDLLLK